MQLLNQFYPYIFEQTLDWTFLKVHIPLNKKLKKEGVFFRPKISCFDHVAPFGLNFLKRALMKNIYMAHFVFSII